LFFKILFYLKDGIKNVVQAGPRTPGFREWPKHSKVWKDGPDMHGPSYSDHCLDLEPKLIFSVGFF